MSNWNSLKKKIGAADARTAQAASAANTIHKEISTPMSPEEVKLAGMLKRLREKAVALDCEMVGTGMNGKYSELARCSLVDSSGQVLYDEYVQPKGYVTDFRTQWSGIRRSDINKNKAVTLEECQQSIMDLLKGKVLVGHALQNDMKVLMLSHPRLLVRDTSRYPAYMRNLPNGKRRPRALRDLTQQFLNKTIQTGEHDSVEDARCTMELYLRAQREWELHLRQKKMTAREQTSSQKDSTVTGASTESAEDTPSGSVENQPSDQGDRKGTTRSEDAETPRKRSREEHIAQPSLKRTKIGSLQSEGSKFSQEHAKVSETVTKRAWVTKQQRRESRKRLRQSK